MTDILYGLLLLAMVAAAGAAGCWLWKQPSPGETPEDYEDRKAW